MEKLRIAVDARRRSSLRPTDALLARVQNSPSSSAKLVDAASLQSKAPASVVLPPAPISSATIAAPFSCPQRSAEPTGAADPVHLAARLLENGEFDGALKQLEEGLLRTPASLALQITRANVLTVMGRHHEARRLYREVISAEPLCAEAHLFLGIACFEAGSTDDAEANRELTRALFLEPDLGLAHYYAGRIAERSGDLAGARRAYRNAVSACQGRSGWTPLVGYFPDLPSDPGVVARAARYALAALEEL